MTRPTALLTKNAIRPGAIGRSSGRHMSMAFGNPYGDEYSSDIVSTWVDRIVDLGVDIVSLADTTGMSVASQIQPLSTLLTTKYPSVEFGLHLHTRMDNWGSKLEAALAGGITRVDGALKGIGGCPMAQDELVGNLDTSLIIDYLKSRGMMKPLDDSALAAALHKAEAIFT